MLLIGCTYFAPEPRKPDQGDVPAAYSIQNLVVQSSQHWWLCFNAPELNALVQEALGGNFSLHESRARLRQVLAMARMSRALLFPDLALEGDASHAYKDTADTSITFNPKESFELGLATRLYEIDLWGRNRAVHKADILAASASREDLNTAAIALASNVVTRWIGIQSQRKQKELLKQQLDANLTLLELVELRFRKALASALDVFQQQQVVARSRAQMPLVEQSERQLLNELGLLLGRTPYAPLNVKTGSLDIPEDVPASGIPAQLLTARPDIRAALLRLQSADWQVAAARADQLPNISLTARVSYQADELNLLFDKWLRNLSVNLTAPLLDAGRRAAEVERQRAIVAEKLAAYRGLVLNAVREVEDALVSEAKLREHLAELQIQLNASNNALSEARSRYSNGLIDYLPVLTELITVQNLELTLIQRKADLLVARVNLYQALGGTWTETLKP